MEYVISNGSKWWTGNGWGAFEFAKVYKVRARAHADADKMAKDGARPMPYFGKAAPQGSRFHIPERKPNYYKAK